MKQRAPMCKKSKPRSSSSKLSPRSARNADIEMGRRIRLRRWETGISQIELAGRLGLSFQQVQKYEKGTRSARLPFVSLDRRVALFSRSTHFTAKEMMKLNRSERKATN
jgi:transcriptional regulator with XRE-family HTH domain